MYMSNAPSATTTATKAKREELAEYLHYGTESYFESLAEHNSEVSAFGDAGPGSGLGLNDFRRSLIATARQIDAMTRYLVRIGAEPAGTWSTGDISATLPSANGPR